jgi:hypothetical protein
MDFAWWIWGRGEKLDKREAWQDVTPHNHQPMKVRILSDTYWTAKIDHAIRPLSLHSYFDQRNYGAGLAGVVIVLMCQSGELHLRQRIRFERSTRTLHLDVMLDLNEMTRLDHAGRRKVIAERVLAEVARILSARGLAEFDATAFNNDLRVVIQEQLLGPEADRFDHLCKSNATS